MKTQLIEGAKSELAGLPDFPAQYAVINRRGFPVAHGSTEETALENAGSVLAAARKQAHIDRNWAADKRSDPEWDWAKDLLY